MAATPQDVIGFWRLAGPEKWFSKNPKFDDAIALKFEPVHLRAARGEYDAWAVSPEGSLALLILLDQFPRNAFRATPHMYATDPLARHLARKAVEAGHMDAVEPALRLFFCLPFAHSEQMEDQDKSVELNSLLGSTERSHAEGHRDIIRRFGRFPHRNPLLLRETTAEERAFLGGGGFSG